MRAVGFTGTQQGMTEAQVHRVRVLLGHFRRHGAVEFHHGDCVGADAEADLVAREHRYRIHLHPGPDGPKRAHCERRTPGPARVYAAAPYLHRNTDIVRAADVLVAAPKEPREVRRSGTWATIRRAWKKEILVYVVQPDGMVAP